MADDLANYVLVLVFGVVATLGVGQVLLHTGRAVLEDAFSDERVARSVNGLLAVLFHLTAFGVLALISTVDLPVTGAVQTVVTKLGIVLLILGAALGLFILMLTRIRARSRRQTVREMSVHLDAVRRRAATNPSAMQPPVMGIESTLPR